MISPFLLATKQLSAFEKGQIVVHCGSGQSFWDIAKKLNPLHSSIDFSLKNNNKIGNYHQKENRGLKKKNYRT